MAKLGQELFKPKAVLEVLREYAPLPVLGDKTELLECADRIFKDVILTRPCRTPFWPTKVWYTSPHACTQEVQANMTQLLIKIWNMPPHEGGGYDPNSFTTAWELREKLLKPDMFLSDIGLEALQANEISVRYDIDRCIHAYGMPRPAEAAFDPKTASGDLAIGGFIALTDATVTATITGKTR